MKAYYEWMEQEGIDITYSSNTGMFSIGDTITNQIGSSGIVNLVNVNTNYIQVGNVNGLFSKNDLITNQNGISASVFSVYNSGVIASARSLSDYMDIDRTEQQFIKYFKDTYINSLPENVIANKQLLVKHILDLYRSKGTQRAYELLFRLIFNEDIEIYIPNNYIFRPSDNNWKTPRYIEVTGNQYLNKLIGKQIYSASESATAIVETVYSKVEKNRVINVIYLSSIEGKFKFGDKILSLDVPEITIQNAPSVIGSLTTVAIENGGYGFSPGDRLNVLGSGSGGSGTVVSTTNENGKVVFTLLNGGFGYSLNANIAVLTTKNLFLSKMSTPFTVNTVIRDTTTNANGTVVVANTTFVQLVNFSGSLPFSNGDVVTDGTISGTIINSSGGGGSGATFKIGGLENPEIYYVNTDYINGAYNLTLDIPSATSNTFVITFNSNTGPFSANGNTIYSSTNSVILDVITESSSNVVVGESLSNSSLGISGLYVYRSEPNLIWVTGTDTHLTNVNLVGNTVLISNTTSSVVKLVNVFPKQTIVGNGTIYGISTSGSNYTIGVTFPNGLPPVVNGYFVPTGTLVDSYSGHTANIVSVQRTDNWDYFQPAGLQNLDSIIDQYLVYTTLKVGTITYITSINPSSGYSSNPYVSIIEPDIAALAIPDGNGGFKGEDAVVNAIATSANGIVTSLSIDDSGIGYIPGETVTLQSTNTVNQTVVTGTAVVQLDGVGQGYWENNRSFVSDINYLQDSNFYQSYSYQIVAERMIDTYEELVRNLVHPSGIALFGKFVVKSYLTSENSEPEQFILSQNNTTLYTDINT
jgi:hypothetical protein